MTLLSYEIFQTVIDQGSFAKAANVLHLTPSAISHAISSMEEEIGFSLFIRSKSGVQLTNAGSQIYPYIQKIITSNENLMQAVDKMKGLQTGCVKIGCTNTVCLSWIPDIITSFVNAHPQISLEVYQGSYSDVVNWIRTGVIDIGFVSKAANEGLPFIPLYEDNLVCVVPKGYMPTTTQFITPDDLKNQPFVIQQESCDKDIMNFLNKYHLSIRANCHILDDQSTMAMVECGAGISIMPQLFTKTVHGNVDIYPIQPVQTRTLGLCCLNPDFLSPATKEMIDHIKKYVSTK